MTRKTEYIFCLFWMLVNMEVCGQISYHETVTQGLRFQMQADSVQRLVEAQILALATAPESKKDGIKIALRDDEAMAVALQKKANEWFSEAATFEEKPMPESVVKAELSVETQDTVIMAEAEITHETIEIQNVQKSEFAILPKSPYSAANPIPVDHSLPDGVVYKIQLGAFSKPLPTNAFKGLTPLSGEKLDNGVVKYYAGFFRRFAEAGDALRKVHDYGFKDAYIVAFYNRKTIHIERAKQLEN